MTEADVVRAGEVFADKYLVKGVIGRGGVGVVVAAEHITLRRPVAIKLLRPEIAYDREVVRRFVREARATARLRSEHVARVMDADKVDGGPAYLVMELLEGRDFGAVLKQDGPLPVGIAVDYVLQACEGVAEAHAAGIVHRDIKATNLFLTTGADGAPLVKVLDFGLSKVESADSRASLTSANHVMGSPHYMAPEQMRSSRDADVRSDIWAIGVVLYTFLTGQLPFKGTYLTEVCAAVLSGSAPSIATLRQEVPAGLAEVVGRCLRVEPADRFQTVVELAAALAPFRDPHDRAGEKVERAAGPVASVPDGGAAHEPTILESLAPASPRRRSPLRWSLPLVGAAVVVIVGILAFRGGTSGAQAPIASSAPSVAGSMAVEPAPSAPATAVVPPVLAPPGDPPPRTHGIGGPRRGTATAAGKTAATASPAAHSGPRKAEEDVILGLPH